MPDYEFGEFRVSPEGRRLTRGGNPASLGSRAFDILVALIERRDRVVSKDELMRAVWPGAIVEENTLAVHVSALRKVLGGDAISTAPGRGYKLVWPVREVGAGGVGSAAPAGPADPDGKPLRRRVLAGSAAAILLVAGSAALFANVSGRPPRPFSPEDRRLSTAVLPIVNLASDASLDKVAGQLTRAIANEFVESGVAVVTPDRVPGQLGQTADPVTMGRALDVHFLVTGTLTSGSDGFVLQARSLDIATGQPVSERTMTVARYGTLYEQRRPARRFFTTAYAAEVGAEVAARASLPEAQLDFRDLLLRAAVSADQDTLAGYRDAWRLANRAYALAPDERHAIIEVAEKIADIVEAGVPGVDPAVESDRALNLFGRVADRQPIGLMAHEARLDLLVSLGRTAEARAYAKSLLQLVPNDRPVLAVLVAADIRDGDPDLALRHEAELDASSPTPFSFGELKRPLIAFAKDDMPGAIAALDAATVRQRSGWSSQYPLYLLASAEALAGRLDDAHRDLAIARVLADGVIFTVSSLPRVAYALPDPAWNRMREGLRLAGMAE